MTTSAPVLIGSQEPTFLWCPPFDESDGDEVVALAAGAGLILDPWQQLMCQLACAVDPLSPSERLAFEVALVVSRQNGKDDWLIAMELAWLFLFGEELITHSAHLFETSREHFLRIQAVIRNNPDYRRRIRRMREGRGAEEIETVDGQRLKFMTRKGGAGRGFTGGKIVINEAMYLDAAALAAVLPTLATVPDCQVFYAGSAGLRHSTQLASVRRRAYARDDPALVYVEWAAEPAAWGPDGELLAGDDPADPRTWARVNPAYGVRISRKYVEKEMRALGGARSTGFGTERLGIGDWPEEDAAWEVFTEAAWLDRMDPESRIVEGSTIAMAIDVDPQRQVGTIGVCGLRADGRDHIEIIERHRGTGWIVPAAGGNDPGEVTGYQRAILDRMEELRKRHKIGVVVVLKTAAASSLIAALIRAKLPVRSPSVIEYGQACGDLFESIEETGTVVHIGQQSLTTAASGMQSRKTTEGGRLWAHLPGAEPVVTVTLALWGRRNMPTIPRSKAW